MVIIDLAQIWSFSTTKGPIWAPLVLTSNGWVPWMMMALPMAALNARISAVGGVNARFLAVHALAAAASFFVIIGWEHLTRSVVKEAHMAQMRAYRLYEIQEYMENLSSPFDDQPIESPSSDPEGSDDADPTIVIATRPAEKSESSAIPIESINFVSNKPKEDSFFDFDRLFIVPKLLRTLIAYAVFSTLAQVMIVGREYARVRSSEAELRSRHDRMRLDSLRSRVDPHFLYNALTNISAATREDARTARSMIGDLVALMRDSSAMRTSLVRTLEDELRLARRYVALVRQRYGERIEVDELVDPQLHDWLVPGWSLQPLIENVVVHGVEQTTETVHVQITAQVEGGSLLLRVNDDAPHTDHSATEGQHSALANLRERLTALFGSESSVSGRRTAERGYEATLRIPHRRPEEIET